MLIETVKAGVFWLNCLPSSNGMSETLSPRQIVIGTQIDYKHHCRIEHGGYAQVHDPHNNNMEARTSGGIALRPTGNLQGGVYFMSLDTGKIINRAHWTELPVPVEVIERVNELGRSTGEGSTVQW
jgi:hypothetical protein